MATVGIKGLTVNDSLQTWLHVLLWISVHRSIISWTVTNGVNQHV